MKLVVQGAPEFVTWMTKYLNEGQTIAYDGKLVSGLLGQIVKSNVLQVGIQVKEDVDLFDTIWLDRPTLPSKPAFILDASETGQSTTSKISTIRSAMAEVKASHHVISTLDDLAWTLNIRGTDVHCNPVVLGFILIGPQEVELFVEESKLSTT